MVKNVLIIFGILILIFLMLVISLINGFKIDNISFKNINIQGLYLKYDKKLIVDTRNISIGYQGDTKSVDMKIKFSIESFYDNYFIEVYEYVLFEPYLKTSGKFILDLEDMSLESILKETKINDFALQFNNNLKFITADNCYVTFKNNNFYFTFNKPIYEGVNLEGSKATIFDLDRLQLELTSQDKLKKPLLELLSNYKINLPLIQEYGKNSISTELLIPFDIKKELKVQSKIALENSKIYLYEIPLYTKKFDILLDNNILKASGTLYKKSDVNNSLSYNSDVIFDIDFKKNIVSGNFITKNSSFKGISLKGIQGDFILDFNSSFFSDIKVAKGKITIQDEEFDASNSLIKYKDSDKTFYSNLNLSNTKQPYTLKIDDQFNLFDINSTGNIEFTYNDKDITLFSNTLAYKANYKNNTNIEFLFKELEGSIFENNVIMKNGEFHYTNDLLDGAIGSLNFNNNLIQFNTQDLLLKYNNNLNASLNLDMNNSKLLIANIDLGLQSSKIKYTKDNLELNNVISNKYQNSTIYSNIDLVNKNISGNIQISKPNKEKKDIFDYGINYKNEILANIPKIGFQLKKTKDNTLTISANKLSLIDDYFDFIGIDTKSKFLLTKDKDGIMNINLEHISIVLDEYYNNILQKDSDKKDLDQKVNIFWKNSYLEFNKLKFYFDTLNLKTIQDNLYLELDKDLTHITIDKINNNTIIKSKKVDADYINLIFGKKILKDGYLDFFVTGGYGKYQGDINFFDTTIIQMQLVDNLLLFLNSAPAMINPLLVIPTVYRLTQNNFEIGGYYIEDGLVKFNYNYLNKYLDIYSLNTNGKINDFSGDLRLDFLENSIEGKLQVSTLKDYAKIINNIPLVNFLFLDNKGQFSIPVSIDGSITDPNYKIINIGKSSE